MATILELAREIRQHIVNRDTGRLTVEFGDRSSTVDFSDGAIHTARENFLACFAEEPVDFDYAATPAAPAENPQAGAPLLIEAIEAIKDTTLVRVWEPYRDWKIQLREDPDIHNSTVRSHMQGPPARLRRLMRLAVSGVVTLEPPPTKPIAEEIAEIRQAVLEGNCWRVLRISPDAAASEIKRAYRKMAHRFHPDKWHAAVDPGLKEQIESVFRDIHSSYVEALASREETQLQIPEKPSTPASPPQAPPPPPPPAQPPRSDPASPEPSTWLESMLGLSVLRRLFTFVFSKQTSVD